MFSKAGGKESEKVAQGAAIGSQPRRRAGWSYMVNSSVKQQRRMRSESVASQSPQLEMTVRAKRTRLAWSPGLKWAPRTVRDGDRRGPAALPAVQMCTLLFVFCHFGTRTNMQNAHLLFGKVHFVFC